MDAIMEALLSEHKKMKTFSRPDGFMLYDILRVDFFSTSENLYPNVKIGLRLIRARPNFFMIRDNPNNSLGIVECSLYTQRVTLKEDYHRKRWHVRAFISLEYDYLGNLAISFIIPARKKPGQPK